MATSTLKALALSAAIFSTIASTSTTLHAEQATLSVNLKEPGARISPDLYGIFFEEINHAGDGGLYAELVRNRSFEDAAMPRGWSLVQSDGAEGTMAVDTAQPLNDKNPRSLRLEIGSQGKGRIGVANEGYWGMGVTAGTSYQLSFYARGDGATPGRWTASLIGSNNEVIATGAPTALPTRTWKQFTCTLTATKSDPKAHLLLLNDAARGTLWLDMVSLMPHNTWRQRRNGLRPDLAGMLDGLRPAFVRFPGGCFVEGDRLADAFRWKQTIGDIAYRPGHPNVIWGYRSTDGLGYHEYLQMCEDLGSEALYVINCGMAHKEVAPLDQLDEWVQDALDAVEYARGPITSRWGAMRAWNGHPKPFNLKYMQIGNENGGPAYNERYARFYDALKARYPDIRIIANVWGSRPTSRPLDIVDEHYYQSPEWFIAHANHYDNYDRKGPKIYVGEYAVTSRNGGQGNLRAAIGEAAFMTGMERNGDIVAMSSYAPLFTHVNDRRWNPDLIGFDSARAYGTPSYYVQQLFSRNRGDIVLPTEITAAEAKGLQGQGGIGLATWLTQAEFKDVTVTRDGQTLLTSDFTTGTTGWQAKAGEWKAEEGAYRQSSRGEGMRSLAGDPKWTDYTLSLKARKLGGAEGFLIMFRVQDDANWYWWNIGGWNNTRHAIERSVGGAKSVISNELAGSIETGRWYDIKIELQGARIRCYLDGKLIHNFEERGPAPLHAVASRQDKSGDLILKVVNVSAAPQETQITLQGAGKVASQGTATVLTSSSPDDENSLEQPAKVAPVTSTVKAIGPAFRHTFVPHSVTILRLKAAP